MLKYEKLLLFYKMKEEGIKKLLKEFWYDKALEETSVFEDYIPEDMLEEVVEYTSKRNRNSRYKYAMFTINFKEKVTLKNAMKKFEKFRTKKWIEKSMSCMEWRGLYLGMHLHSKVWIKDGKRIYDCKREVYNTFKDLVGNKMHVNVRYSNRENCFEEYIKGYKKGKMKDSFAVTELMRENQKVTGILEAAPIKNSSRS